MRYPHFIKNLTQVAKCSYVMNKAKAVSLCLSLFLKQDHRVLEPLGFINLINCSVR